jgi:nitric oxide reductase NorD protein
VDAREIAARIAALLLPFHLPDWELEEYAEIVAELPPSVRERVLDLVPAVWPVSHALTFAFIRNAARGVAVFGETRLQVWVGAILDAYEAGGLDDAQRLIADGGRLFLAELEGTAGLRFAAAAPLLRPFLCGLAERSIDLEEGREAATDTAVVWLPRRMAVFPDPARNFLLYKLAVAVQWGHIATGTYRAELPPGHPLLEGLVRRHATEWRPQPAWLGSFFGLFPDRDLAQRLYEAAALVRVAASIRTGLPGLARQAQPVLQELFSRRAASGGRGGFFEALRRLAWLEEHASADADGPAIDLVARLADPATVPADLLGTVAGIYPRLAVLTGGEVDAEALPFEGTLQPARAEERRRARREEARERFVEALRAVIEGAGAVPRGTGEGEGARPEEQPETIERQSVEAVSDRGSTALAGENADETTFVRVGAQRIELPAELRPLVEEIREDLGEIPASYVSGAIARAGTARTPRASPPAEGGEALLEGVLYDEWDFRRAAFRKGWCALYERDLPPGDPGFTARALRTYRGSFQRIRRGFEAMRTVERFVRRQRDGDEVDIDAVIESRSDEAAGLPAAEGLYVRLVRDRRDIAAVLLVDMSSSTEGWVNTALRESLALLGEALEVLGDRWAVYGFSGTRRLHAEVFRVKGFDEPYGPLVRGRIAAIAPRDYTRMGPPIRHATRLLQSREARVRLLLVLSDGKPEDYDDYRGEYAVEDTRHALIEAKAAGVRPFCITVDKQAPAYVARLFGEVNYVVIDDVARLPLRIPDLYRTLTT